MKKQNKEKLKLKLEDWEHFAFYTLRGKVYGNPKLKDGTEIVTSPIKVANFPESIETYNNIYILGKQKQNKG